MIGGRINFTEEDTEEESAVAVAVVASAAAAATEAAAAAAAAEATEVTEASAVNPGDIENHRWLHTSCALNRSAGSTTNILVIKSRASTDT